MTFEFEPTKKIGRHIYRVYGNRLDFYHANGSEAKGAECDAIAQGYIAGESRIARIQVGLIETTRDTKRAVFNAFSKWATSAPEDKYGAKSPFISFTVTRGGGL